MVRGRADHLLGWADGLHLAALAGFAFVAGWMESAGELPGDRRALVELHRVVGDRVEELSSVVADLTDLGPLAFAAVVVVAALLWARRWADAVRLVAAAGVVWAVNPVLKELFARDRPGLWGGTEQLSAHGFPSGHAANTAALVGALVLVAWRTRWRVPVVVLGALVLVVVGFAQLALGAHYPSDLVAGWLWAGGWVGFVATTSSARRAAHPRARPTAR